MHTFLGEVKKRARALSIATALLAVVALVTVPSPASADDAPVLSASPRVALSANLAEFSPGNIISNEVFFDSTTMTASQIDTFLRAQVPTCRSGYVCLKDFRQDTPTRGADAYCDAYTGAANEPAASIIFKVAQACKMNPQVLLVTLQKEQGLVQHTWPSDWRYTIAMGQGCPDTAECDSKYYGFFNQVYGAARQFQIYSANRYFTYYAPGKTWNILYNPNSGCGSSPVYIANQATSNLYYYTPYQPNAAALRAGYGEGDGCSAYGNRNFFNYFTDWFGSTQIARSALVKLSTDATVWLISAGKRWHIANFEDYSELSRVFGGATVVPQTYISAAQYAGDAGSVLRDPVSGGIYLIQGGARHRILDCETAADLGASCAATIDVAPALVTKVPAGEDVGRFFRVRGSERWGRFEADRAVTPLYDAAAARALNGDVKSTPYAPFLNSDIYAAVPKRALMFAPAQLVKTSDDPRVFFTVDFDRLVHVPTWASVADYNRGPGNLVVVAPGELSGYATNGSMSPLLSCDGVGFVAAGGSLTRIADIGRTGVSAITASGATCAQFPQSDGVISGDVAVKTADSADVFVLDGGTRRAALTWSALVAHNGGTAPVITTLSAGIRDTVPQGAPVITGLVVKSTSSPDLLLGGDARTSWIPSAGLAADLGIALDHRTLADAQIGPIPRGAPLSSLISCGQSIYLGAEGQLWPVTSTASRGFTPSALETGPCLTLRRSGGTPANLIAVKTRDSSSVSVAMDGKIRYVSSWDALVRLNGGAAPRIFTLSRDAFAALPVGEPVTN